MKILLTGGTGFLGAWVARRLLAGGHSVRMFDRSDSRAMLSAIVGKASGEIELRKGDIADAEAVAVATLGCEGIIHLAALLTPDCQADPIRGATVNLLGTLAVFEAARRHGIKQVAYASSAGVYGPDGGAPNPTTQYGAFKLACEFSARVYWLDHQIASVGLRPLVVYGPGREVGSTAGISIACRKAKAGEPYTIPYTGSTDAIFVDDVAAAFVAAVTRPVRGAHALNLHGEIASVTRIIDILRETYPNAVLDAVGAPVPIQPELPDTGTDAVLGPLPRTPLREGLARTIAFQAGGEAT